MNSRPRLTRSKILSLSELCKALKGKRSVVFTNGCFDILHRGHVSYLERARALGSTLIVALNSDSSVRRIKGPSRPVNSLQDRLEVLAALECVDYVTWFSDPTPLRLIQSLKPHLVVKGGDWKPSKIVGAKEVKEWGGRAVSLKFIRGRSTTKIIEKITRL